MNSNYSFHHKKRLPPNNFIAAKRIDTQTDEKSIARARTNFFTLGDFTVVKRRTKRALARGSKKRN